jgi:hypothetical protein
MNSPSSSSWPLDTREHLAAALREQDASPAEIDAWAPIAQRLTDWPAHAITPADTQRLLAVLTPLLPQRSAVRHAVREHYARQRRSSTWLLDTARVQVGILRPTFWLASATVTLLGVYLELASWGSNSALFLHALGPLLAYLGISAAFRSAGLRTVECELACPPSPIQLALARIVLVLGYDVALGLCLSIVGWLRATHSGASFLAITLHWLMPLLLVAGLALVLSLRLRAAVAAGLAYSCWLAAIALYYSLFDGELHLSAGMTPAIPSGVELTLGLAGLALLTIGILRFRASVPRLLPSL